MATETHTELGTKVLDKLVKMRAEKGEVSLEDISAMLEGVAESLGDGHIDLGMEVEKLAKDIIQLKAEVFSITQDEITPGAAANFAAANVELTEVVKMTEDATHTIMDAVDVIQNAASRVNDQSLTEKVSNEVTKIYDACNFQDITGQRINKVMRLMEYMEARLTNLVMLTGGTLPEGYEPISLDKVERPDEHLMEGPQLTEAAPSQDDIDALFDSA